MRAVWKGYLKCGLVTIPVKMYNAVKKKTLQFSLLHKECGTKIKQERFCPSCNRRVSNEELVRGYQYGKDRWIIITDEEIEKAKKESTKIFRRGLSASSRQGNAGGALRRPRPMTRLNECAMIRLL